MEVFDTVRTILAVRAYQDKPVPREIIRKIIEAGRLTGSGMNSQPWHFILVENPETIRLIGSYSPYGPYIAQAPVAIVVAIDKTRFAVSDASRAIQSMILTAWSEGVGSNWVGFLGMEDIKSLVGVPEEMEILAVLPFGYPNRSIGKGKKKRKPLSEVASFERYGQPYK